MKNLYSKYPGTCATCGESFERGTFIKWNGRGRGASHYCCPRNEPSAQVAPCWDCQDPNGRFRSYGAATPVLCDACEAKRRAADHERRNRYSAEDYRRLADYEQPETEDRSRCNPPSSANEPATANRCGVSRANRQADARRPWRADPLPQLRAPFTCAPTDRQRIFPARTQNQQTPARRLDAGKN